MTDRVVEITLITAALIGMGMVGAAFGLGAWFGARLAARLIGREEPVFRDRPEMEIEDEDIDELESS